MTVLETRIDELRQKLFKMAAIVEKMTAASMAALVGRRADEARRVIDEEEPKVNDLEIEIENDAINLIALHQPEASNLRTIVMAIKINNDLERIGDHAVNIAQAAEFLVQRPEVKPLVDLPRMSDEAIRMLADSLDAFARGDAELAEGVCRRDELVDSLRSQINRELVTYMAGDGATIDRALKLMLIARNLERIADLATNIAEDAIYMAKGRVIKHYAEEAEEPASGS
ncbi:phosphate signaling complex protein PhoU [candidate division WOR-3 bacterium]|nr:phosphate signaling complex protein PhoU [candidate division WOR-3 bacterium]